MRGCKFRLYPTIEQEQRLIETLDGCRWVHNYFVSKGFASEYDMNYALTELKEQEPWLYNYHSKMLQMVGKQIAAARKSMNVLRKKGRKVGRLRCKTQEEYNSFSYNQSGYRIVRHGSTDLLWLSKIGYMEIRLHRQLINIKQVIVCRQADKWYAIITSEKTKPIFRFIDPRKSVGIDVGITKFSHDSANLIVENPLFLTKMLKPVRRAYRKLLGRQRGGSNYQKARHMLAKLFG